MYLDLRQVRHFVSVATHGNFARAAKALHLTQPTLTRSIQALERRLGAQLLDRGRTGTTPTAVGQELLRRGQSLLQEATETEREIGSMLGLQSGSILLGTGAYSAEISVGTAVARLVARYPRLSLDISVDDWSELTRGVLEGKLDLAIAELSQALDDKRLAVEPLPRHRGWLFCRSGHPLAAKRGPVKMKDLQDYPLVMTSVPPRMAPLLELGGSAGTRIRVDTFGLMRLIVLESDTVGAAILPQLQPDVAAGRLVMLPVDLPWLQTGYGVIRRANRTPSPAASALIEILKEVEAEVTAAETA